MDLSLVSFDVHTCVRAGWLTNRLAGRFAARIDVVTQRKIYAPASDNFSMYQYRECIVHTIAARPLAFTCTYFSIDARWIFAARKFARALNSLARN